MLRRVVLVGTVLMASSGAFAGPALVFEPYNGTVFYAEDPDTQWFPASLTKLMTAYVAFQALKAGTVTPDTKLICSKEATEQAPSKLWLKVGEFDHARRRTQGTHRRVGKRRRRYDRRGGRRQSGGVRPAHE